MEIADGSGRVTKRVYLEDRQAIPEKCDFPLEWPKKMPHVWVMSAQQGNCSADLETECKCFEAR